MVDMAARATIATELPLMKGSAGEGTPALSPIPT